MGQSGGGGLASLGEVLWGPIRGGIAQFDSGAQGPIMPPPDFRLSNVVFSRFRDVLRGTDDGSSEVHQRSATVIECSARFGAAVRSVLRKESFHGLYTARFVLRPCRVGADH